MSSQYTSSELDFPSIEKCIQNIVRNTAENFSFSFIVRRECTIESIKEKFSYLDRIVDIYLTEMKNNKVKTSPSAFLSMYKFLSHLNFEEMFNNDPTLNVVVSKFSIERFSLGNNFFNHVKFRMVEQYDHEGTMYQLPIGEFIFTTSIVPLLLNPETEETQVLEEETEGKLLH